MKISLDLARNHPKQDRILAVLPTLPNRPCSGWKMHETWLQNYTGAIRKGLRDLKRNASVISTSGRTEHAPA